jgi:hypothetical protein
MTTRSVLFGARRALRTGLGARKPRVAGLAWSKSVESGNLNLTKAAIRRMPATSQKFD